MWCPHGHHVVSMLTQCGYHVDTTWFPGVHYMVCMKTAWFFHVDTMWFWHGHHVVSMCTPHGFHVTDFHHFYITSFANRSWKIANLWRPVTSLIMIKFSICKNFWKALDLFYQLVSFPWVHGCLQIIQISLLSHVITLNQPIGRLSSLKSPRNNRNFRDFVRLHSKFFPHLKSKALRTALLKIDGFQILIGSNIGCMISSNTCSNVLIWNSANISVISWSLSKIFLLKISLISTYKMPHHLLSNLLKASSNLSPNIQKIGILHTGCLPHRVFVCKWGKSDITASFAYVSKLHVGQGCQYGEMAKIQIFPF